MVSGMLCLLPDDIFLTIKSGKERCFILGGAHQYQGILRNMVLIVIGFPDPGVVAGQQGIIAKRVPQTPKSRQGVPDGDDWQPDWRYTNGNNWGGVFKIFFLKCIYDFSCTINS